MNIVIVDGLAERIARLDRSDKHALAETLVAKGIAEELEFLLSTYRMDKMITKETLDSDPAYSVS